MRSHRSVLTDPIEEVILVEVAKESHECEEDPSERHALAQVETRIGLVAVEEQGPAEQGETEGGVERHATRKSETGRIQRFPEEPLIKPSTRLVRVALPIVHPKRTRIPMTRENTPAAAEMKLGRERNAAKRLTSTRW